MKTKTGVTLLVSIMLLVLSGYSFGQIYKWVDDAGKTHFSSSPPMQGKVETVEPKPNIYNSRKLPASENTKTIKSKTKKKVIMYSAIWCGVCKKAKSYFNQKGIPFKEYDIETSSKGKRDYKKLKGSGVPIIMVGKQRMNGFSAKTFQNMYDG